jgi:thiol:disulfide interchange protein/DsbC/DsbD-like thiol-disulfide interchange protein
MKALVTLLLLWAASLGLVSPACAQVGPRAADLVQAELLAEPSAIRPGEPFWVGVRLRMKERWHTYWLNPGDTGLPTEVTWTLPEGFSADPLVFPAPERIPVGELVNYGYEGEVVLLARIQPPAGLSPGRDVTLRAAVNYLVCERECIPGEASIATQIAVARPGETLAPGAERDVFARARAAEPIPSPFAARVEANEHTIVLHLATPGLARDTIRAATFFPFDDTAIRHAAPQTLGFDEGGLTLALTRAEGARGPVTALPGVLRLDEVLDGTVSRQALQIGEAPVKAAAVARAGEAEPVTAASLLGAAAFAFLGGLILNLMPCVFPILSIKVLGLVRQAGGSPGAIRRHGFAYTGGVVLTFLALAGLLLAIRSGGREIGWGFQLQSPLVVAGLAALLLAMGLSLSGLVSFGTRLAGLGEGLAGRSGFTGSFFTGALATIVATPCTAPFMGTAVGFALTAPAAVALAVFLALGLGMAAPFLALTLAPGLIARLPRPGTWMEVLKQALAFPLYATVAWLIFVLSQQVGPSGLFAALLGLVFVAFGLWALGIAASREGWSRRLAQAAALVSLAALALMAAGIARDPGVTAAPGDTARAGTTAEAFTQARLDQLVARGKPVFVNLTAAWCITCLVNERTLASPAVQDAMAARGVVYVKGDWTNQNPEITRLLARNGRSGVPLYLLFSGRGKPAVLPQILTEAGLLESLTGL